MIEITVSPEMAAWIRNRSGHGIACWPDGTGSVRVTLTNAAAETVAVRLANQAAVIRELLQAPV